MRWVSNVSKNDFVGLSYFRGRGYKESVPAATDRYATNELEEMGMVGFYLEEPGDCIPDDLGFMDQSENPEKSC